MGKGGWEKGEERDWMQSIRGERESEREREREKRVSARSGVKKGKYRVNQLK